MKFIPLPLKKPSTLRDLSPKARAEFKQLRLLIDHARKNAWLSDLDMESDHCRIFKATLEDFGATHIHLVNRESRVFISNEQVLGVSNYMRSYGLEIRDGDHVIFVGPRGERDREKSEIRSVNKEHYGASITPTSTWMDVETPPGYESRTDPHQYPLGVRLIAQGLSVLQAADLATTPQVSHPRPRARF